MTAVVGTDISFLHPKAWSMKAIDQKWLDQRAMELADPITGVPDITAALNEVVETLSARIGKNIGSSEQAVVYVPGNETDPYVVGIELRKNTKRGPRAGAKPPYEGAMTVIEMADPRESCLRDDFEDLLFQEDAYLPSIIDRDPQDRYILDWVNERWAGFQMYEQRLVAHNSDHYNGKYAKTLGRYVVGHLATNGAVIFKTMPFRHQTKASAMEEANRQAGVLGGGFAVYRCLDIIHAMPRGSE